VLRVLCISCCVLVIGLLEARSRLEAGVHPDISDISSQQHPQLAAASFSFSIPAPGAPASRAWVAWVACELLTGGLVARGARARSSSSHAKSEKRLAVLVLGALVRLRPVPVDVHSQYNMSYITSHGRGGVRVPAVRGRGRTATADAPVLAPPPVRMKFQPAPLNPEFEPPPQDTRHTATHLVRLGYGVRSARGLPPWCRPCTLHLAQPRCVQHRAPPSSGCCEHSASPSHQPPPPDTQPPAF
jgi:hypothetical protein